MSEREPVTTPEANPAIDLYILIGQIQFAAQDKIAGYEFGDVILARYQVNQPGGACRREHALAYISPDDDMPPMQVLERMDGAVYWRYAVDDEGVVRTWRREEGRWVRDDQKATVSEYQTGLEEFLKLLENYPRVFKRYPMAGLLKLMAGHDPMPA